MARTRKITLTLDGDVVERAEELAAACGVSLSKWITQAARARIIAESARAAGLVYTGPDGEEVTQALRHAAARRAAAVGDGAA